MKMNRFLIVLALLAFVSLPLTVASAQATEDTTPTVDEKSQQIIDRAIEVLGGSKYKNVLTVTGKGFYTGFSQGISQIPTKFIDYIAYPDQERTEFISAGIKTIQTNAGDTGWFYDGAVKVISDQTPVQIADFKRAMRTSLEYLLRGEWKKEGGKVTYVGRREAGLAKRNETIRLTSPSGFWVEYEFGAKDFLPAKIIYKRVRKHPDTGDEVETTEEDRFFKFINNDGINAPFVIDHYVEGTQTSRINYESIVYNATLPNNLFLKPSTVKEIK